jgi:asparagine synthase (glutamine-hydrolysing)
LNPRLFEAPKKGFGLPIDEWLRGGLRPVLEEYTSSARLRAEGLLDADYIAWVRSEHLSGRRNYGRKLHAVIAWEVWAEKMANK